MYDASCDASQGRLTAIIVPGRDEAIIYCDGRPILLAFLADRWSCDHTIAYVERASPLAFDGLEAITRVRADSLTGFLDAVWNALNEHASALLRS